MDANGNEAAADNPTSWNTVYPLDLGPGCSQIQKILSTQKVNDLRKVLEEICNPRTKFLFQIVSKDAVTLQGHFSQQEGKITDSRCKEDQKVPPQVPHRARKNY